VDLTFPGQTVTIDTEINRSSPIVFTSCLESCDKAASRDVNSSRSKCFAPIKLKTFEQEEMLT
jgi:hypothetical protein